MAKHLSKVLTIRVSEAEAKALTDGAAERGICLSDHVRDLLRSSLAVERSSTSVSLDSKEHRMLGYMLAELVALRAIAVKTADPETLSNLFGAAKEFADSKMKEWELS